MDKVQIYRKTAHKIKLDPIAKWAGIIITIILVIVFLFQYLVSTSIIQNPAHLEWYHRFLYFDYMFIFFTACTAIVLGIILVLLGYKNKKLIGIGFLLGGFIFGGVGFYYFDRIFNRPNLPSNVYEALIGVIATIIGFLLAICVAFIVIVGTRITKGE